MQAKIRTVGESQPFPYTQLGTLALCRLAEPIALVSILPYAYSMVQYFGFCDPLHAGLWSGILIASFSLCEAAVCPLWGALSDKIGRKPVLLVGMSGTMLSMLLMGFASNYWSALAARCVGGVLNGNVGVIQTIVGESCRNPDHQPRAFALMPAVWLLGTIIGPSIGAFGVGRLWSQRPYLLPNLICALILCLAIAFAWVFLEETKPDLIAEKQQTEALETKEFYEPAKENMSARSYGTFSRVPSEETLVGSQTETSSFLAKARSFRAEICSYNDYPETYNGMTFTRRVILLCGALALFSYHNMCFEHLLPILLLDPRPSNPAHGLPSGGLGFMQQQVGLVMSLHGILALTIQLFVVPALTARVGVFRLFQLSMLFHPLAYIFAPLIPALPVSPAWGLYAGILVELLLFNLASIVLYPLVLILIQDAVPHPSVIGRVNGVAASCGALARALAPPLAGWFHGIGERNGIPGLAWWSTGIVALLACFEMWMIERSDGVVPDDERPVWLLGDENVIMSDSEDDESDSSERSSLLACADSRRSRRQMTTGRIIIKPKRFGSR